jgi:formate hydrogenlyase transcriptional activator
MADVVVRHRDLPELFRDLATRIAGVVSFDLILFSLHNPATNAMRLVHWQAPDAAFEDVGELSLEEAPSGWVWQNQRPLIIHDVATTRQFRKGLRVLRAAGIRSYCCLPLTTAQRRLGGMGLGCRGQHVCTDNAIVFLQRVAELAALAIENVQTHGALQQEKERLQMLLEVNAALVSNQDILQLFPTISGFIRKVVKQDFASLALYDEGSQGLRQYAIDWPSGNGSYGSLPAEIPVRGSVPGRAFLERETKVFNHCELMAARSSLVDKVGAQSACCIPLATRKGIIGTLNFASRQENAFNPQDVGLLNQIAGQIAIALDNARAHSEIAALTERLSEEKLYLQEEMRSEYNFEEIIGESPALRHVLEQAKTVAASDATVLILGDTGTGKELIAHAIHRMSSRKDASFIKMNCAAIPTGLLESELFGHEKGAFTGAISQKVGRLELADKGTLFLDEVGDIPLELQPKLLRVLQDQEFERLGGTRTLRVHVRLVAATNQDLEQKVAEKEFRSDLFYRLNVFPIRVPPLVERREDIPLLVRYFVQKFARRMSKHIEGVSPEAMQTLLSWSWPGKVRELENFIERSVILSTGPVLEVPKSELGINRSNGHEGQTLENLEREYIIRVLRETGGVIAGANGAAVRLGLKRTTLQSRIQRMGISRRDYYHS